MTANRALEIGNEILTKLKVEGDVLDISPKEYEEFIGKAIEALEKQIPKRPKDADETRGICLTCETRLLRHIDRYCWHCGQAIDWSEGK